MLARTITIFVSCYVLIAAAKYCPPRDLHQVEEGRRCRKSCLVTEDCRFSPNKTCQCDGACGMSCFNKMGQCPEPADIVNGKVRWNHLRWGGTTYYSCNEPYALVGSKTRQCHADKKWSGNAPTCERGCYAPKDIKFSYVADESNGFILGASYRFACFTGYFMTGNPIRSCTLEGWTDVEFDCSLVQCDQLPYVSNGEIVMTKGRNFGSVASLQCDEGYRSTSPGQKARCFPGERGSEFGVWTGEIPSCEIITCHEPNPPDHGSIRYIGHVAPRYGTLIDYNCQNGFKIMGPKTGRCNEDGNWGKKPVCVENFDCDFSNSVCGYTNIKWNRVDSSEIPRDFVLQSDYGDSFFISSRTPREWDAICLAFRYKLPTKKPTESALTVEASYEEEVYWQTMSGEETDIWQWAQVTIILSDRSFQFHASQKSVLLDDIVVFPGECNGLCQNVTCLNGGTCYGNGDSFSCFCEEGFYGPKCENEITCDTRHPEENSYLSNMKPRWVHGDRAEYNCDDGYVNIDPDTFEEMPTSITCLSNGTWSSSPPKCPRPFCILRDNHVTGPFAVFTKPRYNVNETVLLACKKGYKMDDDPSLICQSIFTWNKRVPACQKISCGLIPRVAHSTAARTPDLHYGEFFDFTGCVSEYYMDGPTRVDCRFDGSLSRLPTCKRKERCFDSFPTIENGRKDVRNTVAYFYCDSMYALEGEQEIHCKEDGTWNHPAPHCKEIEPSKLLRYGGAEYLIFMDPWLKSSYDESQEKCGRLNGNLAILYESQITERLENILKPLEECHYKLYIGLKAPEAGGEFEWDLSHAKTDIPRRKKHSEYRNWQIWAGWSPDENQCAVMERKRPGRFDPITKKFGWIPVRCNEGYYFICQRDFDPCTPNPCANGGTCSSFSEVATCHCHNGYRGEHCLEEIYCSINDLASNIVTHHRSRRVRMGSEISIQCKDGYRMVGYEKITCGQDGQWNYQREKCREITCGELQVPEGVLVKDFSTLSYATGSEALFYCPENFRFEGYAGAICGLDGKWSNITAACKVTKCDTPVLPDRFYIKEDVEDFSSGTFVTLGCLGSRYLSGSSTLRCEEGQWSSITAECIVPYCTIDIILLGYDLEFVEISMSQVMNRNFETGDRLTLRCRDSNQEVSHWNQDDVLPVITCQRGGRWSPNYEDFACES